jgi:transposase InsO family protein
VHHLSGFLRRAVAWFARRGVHAQRVLSDNASAYRSRLVAAACQALTLAHCFTRPYTPRTNGKAERFIQILLREWAYVIAYPSSAHRTAALTRLAALLQLASASHGPAPPTTHQQSRRSGRSVETSHLALFAVLFVLVDQDLSRDDDA